MHIIPFFLKVGGELMNKEFIFKIIDVKKNNKELGRKKLNFHYL